MKKVALIGSTGQLGSALLEELGGENVFPFSHQQIEIGDLKQMHALYHPREKSRS